MFQLVKVKMFISIHSKMGFVVPIIVTNSKKISIIKGLDIVDKIYPNILCYFALKYPNKESVNASMSGTAISTLKSITVDFEKTVKNRVNKTAVAII